MKTLSVAEKIKKKLDAAIQTIVDNKDDNVKNPGKDFTRDRKLPFERVLKLLISMGGASLKKELFHYSEITGITATSSAFVQQRKKFGPEALRDIFRCFNQNCCDRKTFRGYHVYAADGSDINIARDPDSNTFISSSQYPRGYNQYHLNALYDLYSHTYLDVELQPRPQEDERDALINMLRRNTFTGKNMIITDRGYEGYNMFANFIETNGVDFVCRVKDRGGALAEVKKLPMQELDEDIIVVITTTQTKEDKLYNRRFIQTGSKKGKINSPRTHVGKWDFCTPYTIKVRAVRFMLDTGKYETILTSLPRDVFSIQDIKEIYHMRWGIETSFRKLKYFADLVNLHGKSDEFAAQEIYAALIIYNFCERIAGSVVISKCDKRFHCYQINFSMAFFLCRNYYKWQNIDGCKLVEDISRYIEPVRPGRKDKRKMRAKAFTGFIYRIAA